MFDPSKGPMKSATTDKKKPEAAAPTPMKILFDPSKKAGPPKSMEAKNVKTIDSAKKQQEAHINDQVHKADKENKQKAAVKAENKEEVIEEKPRAQPIVKSKMKQASTEAMNGEKHKPAEAVSPKIK